MKVLADDLSKPWRAARSAPWFIRRSEGVARRVQAARRGARQEVRGRRLSCHAQNVKALDLMQVRRRGGAECARAGGHASRSVRRGQGFLHTAGAGVLAWDRTVGQVESRSPERAEASSVTVTIKCNPRREPGRAADLEVQA